MSKEEQRLLSYIPAGSDKPRPIKELEKLTGLSKRDVQATINRLIVVHHKPIGAIRGKGNGYFLITSEEERKLAIAPLSSQIINMARRVRVIRNAKLEDKPTSNVL